MKNGTVWLIAVILGALISGGWSSRAIAHSQVLHLDQDGGVFYKLVEQEVTPTDTPFITQVETPPDRVLPPVGSNALLDLGAIVIVMIIIGGVLGVRRRQKH